MMFVKVVCIVKDQTKRMTGSRAIWECEMIDTDQRKESGSMVLNKVRQREGARWRMRDVQKVRIYRWSKTFRNVLKLIVGRKRSPRLTTFHHWERGSCSELEISENPGGQNEALPWNQSRE